MNSNFTHTPIRGFIFDIDGTLLDSNDAHARCLQAALAGEGFHHPYQEVRRLIGMGVDQILPLLAGISEESEAGQRISKAKGRCFEERFGKISAFRGARELIEALHGQGLKLTVATSASREDLQKYLKKLEIEPFLTEVASSDDAQLSKPDPDLVRAGLRHLDLAPDEVVMVGDTPYDIIAAKRAGVRTIAVRSGGWGDESLKEAWMIFDHVHELLDKITAVIDTGASRGTPNRRSSLSST